ncbi:MAG: isoprenylcysteine carboxylmethyltransferase family protein [Gemmatimonadetes bacterium]|nr:isoprenylcysteine carboxylmethyltransferase family protein [Gemmatimonadota bacterium]NNM06866.1 isoprenylcysteine carboxylmethyltransferase family protein [Gemmatimonadota bacterium]
MIPRGDDPGDPTFRAQRLRLVWLLAIPFLLLSEPSPPRLIVGFLISVPGLFLRAYAAGSIHKEKELARGGPYRHLRHPLYLGSFFLGLGFSIAGGRWWFPFLYAGLFFWLYGRTIRAEERRLYALYGVEFGSYRDSVPAFFPRRKSAPPVPETEGFRFRLFRRNREWQAGVGALVGFGLLFLRMYLMG